MAAIGAALEQALACHRAPMLLAGAAGRPLPDAMLVLLRIAAGDVELANAMAKASGESPARVTEASVFFLQQVLFSPGADSFRLLGVDQDAPDTLIKEHHRWLVRWQHPDRNRDDWDGVYLDRINRAWQDLRTPERRAAYLVSRDEAAEFAAGTTGVRRATQAPKPPVHVASAWYQEEDVGYSPSLRRRVPALVLGLLSIGAASLIAILWWDANARREPRPAAGAMAEVAPVDSEGSDPASTWAADAGLLLENSPAEPGVAANPLPPEPVSGAAPAGPVAEPVRVAPLPEVAVAGLPAPSIAVASYGSPAPVGANSSRPEIPPATPRPSAAPPETVRSARAEAAVAAAVRAERGAATDPATAARERAPAQAVRALPPSQGEAEAVLTRFLKAYGEGDLRALMALFCRDASGNRGGVDAIADDYRAFFSGTRARELELKHLDWVVGENSIAAVADFRVKVKMTDEWSSRRTHGGIRFEFRREDGELKIGRMIHNER